jgi:hypothetical protein
MSMMLIPKIALIVVGGWFIFDSRKGLGRTDRQRRLNLVRGIFLLAVALLLLLA